MNQLNSLIIEGNVVRAAELSEPTAGFKVCKFPVAVNRWYKNRNGESVSEVSYFDVETYGRMAEICEKQGAKGRGVRVVGRLKQDRWKDSDGKNISKIYVVAEHIEYKPKVISAENDTANTNAANDSKPENLVQNAITENSVTSSDIPVEEVSQSVQVPEPVAVPAGEPLMF